jgi:branched-chain amino acid transport system substrate-binding protein
MAILRTKIRRSAVVIVAAVLVFAACSSDNKSSTSASSASGGQGGASSAPKATGTPINIGLIGSFTGSQASSSNQGQTVGPAWERYVNEQLGGINGHPVKVIAEDDGGDPAKAQAAEKKLVDGDKVAAIIVSSDNLITAYSDDAIAKGVPLISGTANQQDWYTKQNVFVTVTDVLSGLKAQVAVAKDFGKATKFADLYCSEVAACQQADPPLKGAAEAAGVGFTSIAISSTATSYTAECLQLQQEGVDYVQLNFTTAAAAKLVQDCQSQNYNPTYGSSEQAIGKDLLDIDGIKVFGPAYAFPSVADAPAAQEFRDAMGKFAKDDNWKEGTGSFTWSGLEMLRKALASAPAASSPVAAKDVVTGLSTVSSENLGGLLANKVTYTSGKTDSFGSHPCYFVVGIDGGKTIAPANLDAKCVS